MKTIRKRVLSLFTAMVMVCSMVVYLPTFEIHSYARVNGTANFYRNYSLSGNGASDIVAVAFAQLGRNGGNLGYSAEEWCADFVSDCAILAGQSSAIPKNARCTDMYKAIIKNGGKDVTASEARPGDIVFENNYDHVGIVYEQPGNTLSSLRTIEGNTGNQNNSLSIVNTFSNKSSRMQVVRPNYSGSIPINFPGTEDTSYNVPITVYATHKINEIYNNSNGSLESGRYISNGDKCYVDHVYTSGLCHVQYPSGSGVTEPNRWAYCKASELPLTKKPTNHDPIGHVDRIEGGNGKVNIYGWTYDPDNSSKSLEIHVYIGGSAGSNTVIHSTGGIMANADSPDVNSAYNINGKHRFNTWIETTARGNQPVYVYAINSEGGNNPCIGSGTVNITEPIPQGQEMSAGAGQTIPDGDYIIVSELGRRIYLDIPEVAFPAPEGIDVAICAGSTLPGKNDLFDTWTVKYLGNGYYKIIQNEKCGKEVSLDVKNDSKAVGADIMTHYYHGGHNQQWSISETSHGYRIQSRSTSWYLDVRDAGTATGTKVQMCQAIAGDKAQAWGFIPIATDDRPVADGTYKIKSECGDVYLDAYGHANTGDYVNGTNIDIALSKNDSFNIAYVDDGFYTLREASTGLAVEVEDEDKTTFLNKDKNIQLGTFTGERRQLWKIVDEGNGKIRFVSKLSGYSLDLAGMKTENGSNVQQHPYNTSNAQKWSFEPVDSTKPVITDVQVTDVSSTGYTVTCKVTDEGGSGLDRVQFPTWTTNDGQDDIQSSWETNSAASGKINGDTVTFRVNVSDHGNEHGFYRTHIYAYDKHNNYKTYVVDDINVPHKYKEETIPETCTDPGIKTYTCDCGDTYTEEIPALGHDFSSKWTIDVWPTATTTGNKSHHCTRCNEKTDVTEIPATGISNPSVKYIPNVNSINLSWNDVIGAEQYAICGYTNGKWQILAKTDGTSYTLNKLKAETEYKITVIAMFDGEWNKDFSNEITVTPKAEIISLYPAVQTQVKDGKIGFKWTKVPGAEKYGIGIYQANKWKVIKQLDGSVSSWTSPQVRSGKYRLVVLAKVDGQWVNADVFKKAFYVTVS